MSSNVKFPEADVRQILEEGLSRKLKKYKRETESIPFLEAMLTRERVKMYSFVHSLATSYGQSFFEKMAECIAKPFSTEAQTQYDLLGSIPDAVALRIREILSQLRLGTRTANKEDETNEIRELYQTAMPRQLDPDSRVDLRILFKSGCEYLIDVTSAKPNKKEFATLKDKLLKWTALRLSQDREANVVSCIAIPYNPWEPAPYSHWTEENLYDRSKELLIAGEFWNLVGQSPDTYASLLAVFRDVGREWKPRIDSFIQKLASSKGISTKPELEF